TLPVAPRTATFTPMDLLLLEAGDVARLGPRFNASGRPGHGAAAGFPPIGPADRTSGTVGAPADYGSVMRIAIDKAWSAALAAAALLAAGSAAAQDARYTAQELTPELTLISGPDGASVLGRAGEEIVLID